MRPVLKFTGLIGLLAPACLIGCQPTDMVSPVAPVELPTSLSDSYQLALLEAPRETGRRFLIAYDAFAETGPVTRERLQKYAEMRAALERGKFLGHILAMDLNGDMNITRSEVDAVLALPSWSNRPVMIEDLFDSDQNGDGVVSLAEARRHSHVLYERSAAADMRPIESYFLLADLNADEIVTTEEMEIYLYRRVTGSDPQPQGLRGDASGALPR